MKVSVPSKARGLLAIRLSAQERAVLEAAAAIRPEYVTTFIRQAALKAARQELANAKPQA